MDLVERDDDLAVRSSLESIVVGSDEVSADTVGVVEFAVDDGVDAAVGGGRGGGGRMERLGAGRGEVVDREAAVGEAYVLVSACACVGVETKGKARQGGDGNEMR